jgi:hypothetical protein
MEPDTTPTPTTVTKKKVKRGRKPKGKCAVVPDSHIETVPISGALIVNVKPPAKVDDAVQGMDDEQDMNMGLISNEGALMEQHELSSSQTLCWNCGDCHNSSVSVPFKRQLGVYHVFGSFCSFECGARYLYETFENREMWDRYLLLNMYYNESLGTHGKKITMAPPKTTLQDFGGTLSREEYRERLKHNVSSLYIMPPLIPVNHIEYSGESHVRVNKGYMKLYRMKPVKRNHILDSMNIAT